MRYGSTWSKISILINKRESKGLQYLNDPKALIEFSNYMDDIYKTIEENDPNKKQKNINHI